MSLFSRLKVWMANETIHTPDLNGEFDNIITNMVPNSIIGYEATVPQMRTQTDPGAQGSENQASSLGGEFERLRFVINRALGGTFWYDNPNTSLAAIQATLNTSVIVSQNRVVSGRVNSDNSPMFITPDTGSNNVLKLKATSVNLSAYIKNSLVTVASDLSTTLSGPSSFTLAVNDSTMTGQAASKLQGENGTTIIVGTPSGTAPAVGSYQAWKVVHSATTEYFFARYGSSTTLDKASRGYFFGSTDAIIPRTVIANADVITLCRAAYVFLTNNSSIPAIAITYNEPIVSYVQPSSPNSGDWWLDLSTGGIWRVFSGGTFVDGNGTILGVAVVDGSSVVGARSKSFDRGFSSLNGVSLELADVATVRSVGQGARISVYGNSYEFTRTNIVWASPGQLDSGVTIGNSTTYYLYISDKGQPFISDVAPYATLGSLLGYYHPAKPWRAVGFFVTDSSGNFQTPINFDYLGLTAGFVDQTRLGVAPQTPPVLSVPTSASGLNLTTAYQTVPTTQGGSTTLVLNNRPVLVNINLAVGNGDGSGRTILIQVLRGATVIRTYIKSLAAVNSNGDLWHLKDLFLDSGGQGSTVYSVQAKFTSGTTVTLYTTSVSAAAGVTTVSSECSMIGNQTTTGGSTTGLNAIEAIEL